MFSRLLTFLCLLIFLPASLAQQSEPTAPEAVPDSCPVTKQSDKPFVAPFPYPAQAPKGSFWFGTDNLWTLLGNPRWPMGQKTFWWRQDWGRYKWIPEEQASKLTVTARRLDAVSQSSEILKANSSYREQDWKAFLVGGINFSTPGCWEITGRYDDDELSYVVWVVK